MTAAYAYDLADRQVSVSAPGLVTIATAYAYDGLDRVTGETHGVTGTVSHTWDNAGRRTGVSTSTGAPAVAYTYDAAGHPLNVTKGGATYAVAAYAAAGRLSTITRYNAGVAGAKTTYTYDNADRPTALQTKQGTATLGTFTYTLNRLGQATAATEAIGGTSRTVAYAYDGLLRLSGATESVGAAYGYTYDLAGNRTGVTVNGAQTQSRAYDVADQVVGWQYDGVGNLLSDGATAYAYDPLGRLAGATAGGAATTYGYTGDGALAVRVAGGATTRYTLDTGGGLVERLGATTTSGGATATTWYVRGYGAELARETSAGTTWFLADRQASTRAEYGATAGSLGVRVDYDPFGAPEGPQPADYGYAGEPRDGALVHLRARWYASGTGQFTARDTWGGDPQRPLTFAPYAYVHDDPINGTDPTGRFRGELAMDKWNTNGDSWNDEATSLGRAGSPKVSAWWCPDILPAILTDQAGPTLVGFWPEFLPRLPIEPPSKSPDFGNRIPLKPGEFIGYHGTIAREARALASQGVRPVATLLHKVQLGSGFYVALDRDVAVEWGKVKAQNTWFDTHGQVSSRDLEVVVFKVYASNFGRMSSAWVEEDKWFKIGLDDPLMKRDYCSVTREVGGRVAGA